MMISRYETPACIAVAVLLLAGCAAPASSTTEATSAESTSTAPVIRLTDEERVASAEAEALTALPDAPVWKGMVFDGVVVNESEICVNRTWPPGGGLDHEGGSAGYVVVRFPEVALSEPQDGLCKSYVSAESRPPVTVEVPAAVANDPGLLLGTTFGDEWPLTVPYAVVRCEEISVAGRTLQVATVVSPDGKTYAANGTAKDHGNYLDIDPIWAPHPEVSDLKIDISPVVEAALELCI